MFCNNLKLSDGGRKESGRRALRQEEKRRRG
jgi:hypothetical protein